MPGTLKYINRKIEIQIHLSHNLAGHNKTGSMAEAGGFVEQQRLPYYNIFCVCVCECVFCMCECREWSFQFEGFGWKVVK